MPGAKLTPRQVRWARRWMTLVFLGFVVFIIGIEPDLIGMDRSPVVGFVQIYTWLSGLAVLLTGAYLAVRLVRNGRPLSLRAEVGVRLIATGYVVAVAASFADFLGIGSHTLRGGLYFGEVQVLGLVIGVLTSLVGVLLYWPRGPKPSEPASEET
ncbi:MAG: hypothetical protein MUO23_11955 [Anaerolineales bacterium]|nr:hypothetical protein [Anaerolineales bacterium]